MFTTFHCGRSIYLPVYPDTNFSFEARNSWQSFAVVCKLLKLYLKKRKLKFNHLIRECTLHINLTRGFRKNSK